MKSIDQLRNHFETVLKQRLMDLQSLQASARKLILGALAWLVGSIGLGFWFMNAPPIRVDDSVLIGAGVALVAGFVFLVVKGVKAHGTFKTAYKETVVREVFNFFDPGWNYEPSGHVSRQDYDLSGIFRHRVDRYSGEDLVTGSVDGTAFQFSELHTQYKTETRDSKGNRQTQWHTIFKGLFFQAELGRQVPCTTYVLPDTAEKLLGSWLGRKLQALGGRKTLSGHGPLIKLENTAFEKEFVVHGDDEVASRVILNPKMMEQILALKASLKRDISIAYVGERAYVAVSMREDLFEPRLFSSLVRFDDLETMHRTLSRVLEIFDLLDLGKSEIGLSAKTEIQRSA